MKEDETSLKVESSRITNRHNIEALRPTIAVEKKDFADNKNRRSQVTNLHYRKMCTYALIMVFVGDQP